jgi:K+/H+ antiporter YhaU regulatory subunit KhtT
VSVLLVVGATLSQNASQRLFGGRLGNLINLLITMLVVVPSSALYFSLAAAFFPSGTALIAFLIVLLVAGILFWKRMILVNSKMEYLFMESLNEDTRSQEELRRENALTEISRKYPWPVQVVALPVPEGAAGNRLIEFKFREQAGVMVVAVGRGEHIAFDPGPNTPLFPGDRVFVFGQDSEIQKAKRIFQMSRGPWTQKGERTTFEIEKMYLSAESPLVGDSLAGSDLRRRYGINVLGIQRGDTRITAPSAEELLKAGDVLFVIGNRASIKQLQESEPSRSSDNVK